MLNTPINAKIIAAVQSGRPLSIIYFGIWVATRAICHPQTKKPSVRYIKLLLPKASFNASLAVCLLFSSTPTGIFGVLTNKATINPRPKKRLKYINVFSQPVSISEYLTNSGETK